MLAQPTLLLSTLLCAAAAAPGGDKLDFHVAPDTRLEKKVRVSHELQVERVGSARDDGQFVSDGTGGWISSAERLTFTDHYLESNATRPLKFVRDFREIESQGKLSATRGGGQQLDDKSRSTSQLQGKGVAFTWVEAENDWARCFDRVEAEEEALTGLHGEYDLLALLPGHEVAQGDQWDIDLRRVREILAPGGDLAMFPTGGNLFGRLMEIGIGGDFADFIGPNCSGTITATYRGVREIPPAATDGTEPPPPPLRLGVVELAIHIVNSADRTALYAMAMPDSERREAARLESVPLDYTLEGTGELLWDLAGGHFHSLSISGKEIFDAQVIKTQFNGSKEQYKYAQQSRYGGTLSFEVTASDANNVDPDAPKGEGKKGGKKNKHKK